MGGPVPATGFVVAGTESRYRSATAVGVTGRGRSEPPVSNASAARGRGAALGDRPDDQRLPAPDVAGHEDAGHRWT